MSATNKGLWRFGGTISPRSYFSIGFFLTLVKLGLDRIVATMSFGRPWTPVNYILTGEIGGLFSINRDDQHFYAVMLALAIPFVVVGVVLTVRRLRDAGWPLWLVAIFFAPLPINVIFFVVLSFVPSKAQAIAGSVDDFGDVPDEVKLVPSQTGIAYKRAIWSILIPLPFAAIVIYFGTQILRDYGWSLFVGIPFVLPMLSVIIYGSGKKVTAGECQQVGWLWILISIVLTLVTAFEGIICLIMLLPLCIPVVLLGAMVGYYIVKLGPEHSRELGKLVIVLFALLPTMVGAEHFANPKPLLFTCETSVVINASPEKVWQNVVTFSDLAPPTDWVFRTGLAYPLRARIDGTGVGAIRTCEFSTGAFVEPIEVWDEPRLLRFSVTSNPSPMKEWNPLFDIHPPHLDGFLISKEGQFQLIPVRENKTLLKGSTLYQHGLWPAAYWRLWSDPIIHRIHDRVLQHIKLLAEQKS